MPESRLDAGETFEGDVGQRVRHGQESCGGSGGRKGLVDGCAPLARGSLLRFRGGVPNLHGSAVWLKCVSPSACFATCAPAQPASVAQPADARRNLP
jgi:hypothetical protein